MEKNELLDFKNNLKKCLNTLTVMGDETRQHIIFSMLELNCDGVRIKEIMEKTNLSKSSVSYHLRILKKQGIVSLRKEGTKNYYYLDSRQSELDNLKNVVNQISILIEKKHKRLKNNE